MNTLQSGEKTLGLFELDDEAISGMSMTIC
jgi:hypothetical protein